MRIHFLPEAVKYRAIEVRAVTNKMDTTGEQQLSPDWSVSQPPLIMKVGGTLAAILLVSIMGSGYSENIDIIYGDRVTLKCRYSFPGISRGWRTGVEPDQLWVLISMLILTYIQNLLNILLKEKLGTCAMCCAPLRFAITEWKEINCFFLFFDPIFITFGKLLLIL